MAAELTDSRTIMQSIASAMVHEPYMTQMSPRVHTAEPHAAVGPLILKYARGRRYIRAPDSYDSIESKPMILPKPRSVNSRRIRDYIMPQAPCKNRLNVGKALRALPQAYYK